MLKDPEVVSVAALEEVAEVSAEAVVAAALGDPELAARGGQDKRPERYLAMDAGGISKSTDRHPSP